jgi:hypothetical protein
MKPYFRTILLSSGMLAVVIYLLHILIGGYLWKTYSHLQQPISDLTATGAPNRFLLLLLTNIYGGLALIFAVSLTFFERIFRILFRKRASILWFGRTDKYRHTANLDICFVLQIIKIEA